MAIPAVALGDLAQHTTEAIERLVFWMKSKDPRASVAAANSLLDRGYGRPAQLLDLTIETMTQRINELSDSELTLLEQRLLTVAEQSDAKH